MKKIRICAALLLAACAGAVPSHVRQYREAPTGLREGEAVSVYLAHYRNPGVEVEDFPDAFADKAEYFEKCVKEVLERRGVSVVPSALLPPALKESLPASEEPFPPERILQRIESARGEKGWSGPRFLVALDGDSHESDPMDITYMAASGEAFGLIVGQTRVRTTDIRAYVFDPAARRYLGRVESTSWGYVGWEMPILYCILPCVPIPHTARTDVRSCNDLGADLAEFLRRGAPPAPQEEGP